MINEKRLIDQFLNLVQINSETKNEQEIMQYLIKILEGLNLEVTTDAIGKKVDSNGNNIYAKLPGNPNLEPILLSSHMDTVVPGNDVKPVINGDLIETDKTTILGGDDKSGLAIIIECLTTIIENNLENRPIEILFTIFEEGGLFGSKYADYDKITAKHALVLDTGGEIGKIVVTAPSQYVLNANFIGKAAHAGLEPEKGINAIMVAARAINNMNLLRIDEETTANVGIINAGLASNIVTPEAKVKFEARSINSDKLEAQVKHMEETINEAASYYNTTVDLEIIKSYGALNVDHDHPFILDLKKAFEINNFTPKLASTGGGSDANNYTQNNLTAVNISTGMTNAHTVNECIKISDMIGCAKSVLSYLINETK